MLDSSVISSFLGLVLIITRAVSHGILKRQAGADCPDLWSQAKLCQNQLISDYQELMGLVENGYVDEARNRYNEPDAREDRQTCVNKVVQATICCRKFKSCGLFENETKEMGARLKNIEAEMKSLKGKGFHEFLQEI